MYACLIIDDPLLRKKYGFLDYKKLLTLMEKINFHTCIAFIPYNYKRSDKEIIKLFKDRPDRYSLCFHGCDHTEAEFGSVDMEELDKKCKLAIYRMEELRIQTGMNYDNVMVFPQGVFSSVALNVLKTNGFMGAINTVMEPIDNSTYRGLPVFQRWYIDKCFTVLNKHNPIFICAHHKDFKDTAKLCELISEINRQGHVKWQNPKKILKEIGVPAIEIKNLEIETTPKYGTKVKVFIRRRMSELRDNYLDKNDALSRAANSSFIKKVLKKITV